MALLFFLPVIVPPVALLAIIIPTAKRIKRVGKVEKEDKVIFGIIALALLIIIWWIVAAVIAASHID